MRRGVAYDPLARYDLTLDNGVGVRPGVLTFDLEATPTSARLAAWRHAAVQLIHPMVVRADGSFLPRGRIMVDEVFGLRTIRVSGSRSCVTRPRSLIDRTAPGVVQLTMVLEGSIVLEQDAQVGEVDSGGLTWYRTSRPYRLEARSDVFDLVHFLLPERYAGVVREFMAPHPALPIPRGSGAAQVIAPFLAGIAPPHRAARPVHRGGSSLEASLVHLISAVGRGEQPHDDTGADEQLFRMAVQFIDDNLGNAALCPADVAGACHISLRYIHKIFARRGLSVAAHIRDRRLERIAEDLLDPAFRSRTIKAMARTWGFTSPAHFSRAFRVKFDCSPAELRAHTDRSGRTRQSG